MCASGLSAGTGYRHERSYVRCEIRGRRVKSDRVYRQKFTPELLVEARANGRCRASRDRAAGSLTPGHSPTPTPPSDVVAVVGQSVRPHVRAASGGRRRRDARELKPSGRGAFASGHAEHLVGQMFALSGGDSPPPPPGAASPPLWGNPAANGRRPGSAPISDALVTRY